MNLEEFCVSLGSLDLTQVEYAVAVLWYFDREQPSTSCTPGELSRVLRDTGLGTPNSTRLGKSLLATKHVLRDRDGFRIKPTSRAIVEKWVAPILEPSPPNVDQEAGFVPKAVWNGTRRTYIDKVAEQINGCYQCGFYDGASVLVRRLIETLLIECYEHLRIESKIKRNDGNYPMLSEIIVGAVDKCHLSLGREAKTVLKEIKEKGDRSAHNRRYTAVKHDLDEIRSGVRLVVQELLHLAGLK